MSRCATTLTRTSTIIVLVLLTSLAYASANDEDGDDMLRRTKRFVVYPMGGLFKIVCGLATPVKLGLKQSMSAALNLQFQYQVTQNISQVKTWPPIVQRSRQKRDDGQFGDRVLAYLGIETMLDRYGIDGRACLLRSICENAMNSVYHKANGVYGHLAHIFLTPDYGDGEYDDDLDSAYIDAQKAGNYGVDCFSLYPKCPYGHGILDMISTVDE